ncbi:MAG: hypothetical protein LBL90_13195 [Prevotellaceae bacterium]|jgi:hypothetical protein|nr:hypothetical protein [Prevotellaceae bacterium]
MPIIDKYLKELVQNNRRVIIPDLGAFLVKENPDGTKNIIFSSFLRYNDGFLEESIAQKVQLSKPDVSVAIKKFVNEVKRLLRSKRRCDVEGFGYFTLDDKGAVQFVSYEGTIKATNSLVIDNKPINTEEKQAVPVINEPEEVQTKENTVTERPVQASDNTTVIPPKQELPAIPPVEKAVEAPENSQTPPNSPPVIKPESILEKELREAKKRSRLLWVIIFQLIMIIFLLTLLYLHTTNSDLCFLRKKTTPAGQTQISLPVGSIKPVATDSLKMLASPSVRANDDLQYHVIGGCFSEKINAERFLQFALEQGYANAEILPKLGGLYPVSIGKFTDINEAERMLSDYNNKFDEEAWIYRTY